MRDFSSLCFVSTGLKCGVEFSKFLIAAFLFLNSLSLFVINFFISGVRYGRLSLLLASFDGIYLSTRE